ncbi:hypothetical protein [Actinomadura opuntiae]|uniref:hypothetical protein n=1 Tax=Actinomadura sp. OS1-43 TaxID=604315 RepID=UPI00255B288F|nr:hypothetical protein [Actinomadura sp. OS1-43]MDL4820151.1 hypothetical protein [Actinomadura sp. OS1-43]
MLLLERAESDLVDSKISSAKNYLDRMRHLRTDTFDRDPQLICRFLRALAVVHRDTNSVEGAIGAYDQLQLLAIQLKHRELFGEAIIGKLMILLNNDRLPIARQIVRSYDASLSEIDSPAFQAERLFWKARFFEECEQIDTARQLSQKAMLPLSRHAEPDDLRIARHAFASRLALCGPSRDWRTAEVELERAADLVTSDTPLLRKGQLIQGQALFELECGDTDSAISLAKAAEETFLVDGIVSHQLRRLHHRIRKIQ